ncbi:MAG: hypothetical protein ACRYG5_07710 [Janthinobacterium lividum]
MIRKKTLVTIWVASAALAACGGASDGGFGGKAFSGLAVDPYLAGSTVAYQCADKSSGAVVTDSGGHFTLPAGCASPTVHVTGGADVGTGLPFDTYLDTPANASVASELTTFIAASPANRAAIGTFFAAGSADPTTVDPMTNLQLLSAELSGAQLRRGVIDALVALPGGTLSPDAASAFVIQGIVSAAASGKTLDQAGIAAVISAAVTAAAAANALPAAFEADGGAALAANLAALLAPALNAQIVALNAALDGVTVSPTNGAATLATLQSGGVLTSVATLAGTATNLTTLVAAQNASLLADASATASFQTLGLNAALTATQYTNFVAIDNVLTLSGGSTVTTTVDALQSGQGVTLAGPLHTVTFQLSSQGTPLGATGSLQGATGLSYSGAGNTASFVITPMLYSGAPNAALSAATLAPQATVNFSITLANGTSATGEITNVVTDELLGASGVSLNIGAFLQRLAAQSGAASVQGKVLLGAIPVSGAYQFAITLGSVSSSAPLRVGRIINGISQAALPITVTANGASVAGQGVSGTIVLQ